MCLVTLVAMRWYVTIEYIHKGQTNMLTLHALHSSFHSLSQLMLSEDRMLCNYDASYRDRFKYLTDLESTKWNAHINFTKDILCMWNAFFVWTPHLCFFSLILLVTSNVNIYNSMHFDVNHILLYVHQVICLELSIHSAKSAVVLF